MMLTAGFPGHDGAENTSRNGCWTVRRKRHSTACEASASVLRGPPDANLPPALTCVGGLQRARSEADLSKQFGTHRARGCVVCVTNGDAVFHGAIGVRDTGADRLRRFGRRKAMARLRSGTPNA